uniref:C-type lectin domain-containing protein n=1 Tax=Steinernema glaseri TaxID=37863 RepID=A0A1I8A6K6_9BILA
MTPRFPTKEKTAPTVYASGNGPHSAAINKHCQARFRPAMLLLLALLLVLLPGGGFGAAECPRQWVRYERTKSCFFVIQQRLRWSEAERFCERQNAHLASLVDEYENYFAFDVVKKANLSVPTVWLGRLVRLTKTGAYEWNDGAVGRHSEGFREPPSGTDLCLTMWLDFDRPEGSWNEWDCAYATGYSGLCKKSFKHRPTQQTVQVTASPPLLHQARRCCLASPCPFAHRCSSSERCIPDDLDCWTRSCAQGAPGWCLPVP